MSGLTSATLTSAQLAARLRHADGVGSGIEADLSVAARPRNPQPAHSVFAAVATPALNPDAVRARATFGA